MVTTSFHGAAFSIIFEKDFIVCPVEPSIDVRAKELLFSIGLSERLTRESNYSQLSNINWQEVKQKIGHLRSNSISFISESIKI